MFDKFGEFDSAEEINRAAAAQLKEGDLDAIKTIAEENGLDPEDAEDFCTGQLVQIPRTPPHDFAAIGHKRFVVGFQQNIPAGGMSYAFSNAFFCATTRKYRRSAAR